MYVYIQSPSAFVPLRVVIFATHLQKKLTESNKSKLPAKRLCITSLSIRKGTLCNVPLCKVFKQGKVAIAIKGVKIRMVIEQHEF